MTAEELKFKMMENMLKEEKLLRKLFTEIQGSGSICVIGCDVEGVTFFIGESYKQLCQCKHYDHDIKQDSVGGIEFGSVPSDLIPSIKETIQKQGWIYAAGHNQYL